MNPHPTSPLGTLPEGWTLVPLKELVTRVKSGATPRGGESNYLPARKHFALIRSQNVFDRRFDEEGLAFISDEQAAELHTAEVQAGDVLLNITGDGITFGRSTLVPKRVLPACVNQHVMLIRTQPGRCDAGFLLSYLTHPRIKTYIESFNAGGSRRAITKRHVESFLVPLPSLPEQRAIAQILGTLDDKLELNLSMTRTLETLSRALFRSWFLDFDPVRAKLKGHPPAGLDNQTANSFPTRFQESPIGQIPQGWQVEPLDAHVIVERGLSYKGEGLREDRIGLPLHNLNSIYEGGGYKHEGIKYYDGDYRPKHVLKPGDMIVANTEQGFDHLLIGYAAIVPACYGPTGLYSHHIFRVRVRPHSSLTAHYLVHLFNSRRWHQWISGFSNGTTVNMLPMDALQKPLLAVPPPELVRKFTAFAEAAHAQTDADIQQSRTLAALRDILLPRLLSGELSVDNLAPN